MIVYIYMESSTSSNTKEQISHSKYCIFLSITAQNVPKKRSYIYMSIYSITTLLDTVILKEILPIKELCNYFFDNHITFI